MHLMVARSLSWLSSSFELAMRASLGIEACLTEGISGCNVPHAAWLSSLTIWNAFKSKKKRKKWKKRGKNEMRDANASVSNYFHILWRKFSLEAPKTNFQPKRNETKRKMQLQLRSNNNNNKNNNKTSGNWGQQILKRHQDYCTEKFFSSHLLPQRATATWRPKEAAAAAAGGGEKNTPRIKCDFKER